MQDTLRIFMEGHVQLHEKLDDQLRQLVSGLGETNGLLRQMAERSLEVSQRRDGEMTEIARQLGHLDSCVDALRTEVKEVHHPPPANGPKGRPLVPVSIGGVVGTTIAAAIYGLGRSFGWWP